MQFTVIVNAHPDSLPASSALCFCHSLITQGHTLYRLFFYGDGVLNGAAKHPTSTVDNWTKLITENQIDAVCCVGSAQHRQIATEADLRPGFVISGLGQLVDAAVISDRIITFGQRVG